MQTFFVCELKRHVVTQNFFSATGFIYPINKDSAEKEQTCLYSWKSVKSVCSQL